MSEPTPTEHLWPHPTFEKAYAELYKLDGKVEAALKESTKQLEKGHQQYRLLTSHAEQIVHYALAARDNAEATLAAQRTALLALFDEAERTGSQGIAVRGREILG